MDRRDRWLFFTIRLPNTIINGAEIDYLNPQSVASQVGGSDGTVAFVIARHELALQPGLAVWEAFHDPKDGKLKLDGESVIEFRKLTDFTQLTPWEDKDKKFVIKESELVP